MSTVRDKPWKLFLRIANGCLESKAKICGKQGTKPSNIKHQMLAPSSALLTVKRPLLLRSRETLGTASLHSSFTGMKMASHTGIIRTSEKVLTKLEPQQQQKMLHCLAQTKTFNLQNMLFLGYRSILTNQSLNIYATSLLLLQT